MLGKINLLSTTNSEKLLGPLILYPFAISFIFIRSYYIFNSMVRINEEGQMFHSRAPLEPFKLGKT